MRTKKMINALLHNTRLPAIHLTSVQTAASCLDSRFGGIFYLPQGASVPHCPEGEELRFLAQINFAQLPPLAHFPQSGILQFFVDTDRDRFYQKIDSPQARQELYALRYYPNPLESLQQAITEQHFPVSQKITTVIQGGERLSWADYQAQAAPKEKPVSVIMSLIAGKPLPTIEKSEPKPPPTFETVYTSGHLDLPYLKGSMAYQPLTEIATLSLGWQPAADFGYDAAISELTPRLLKCSGYDIENWESDADDFCWDFGNWGCKIGGHPALRAPDIRTQAPKWQAYTTLLFQYDLTTRENLEQDTFQFFIKPTDLAACRFDDVLFCWHNSF